MKKILLLGFVLVLLSTIAVVKFVGPATAEEIIYIRADGSVEGTNKIQCNGSVYTFIDNVNGSIVVEKDDIVIDGAEYTLQGAGTGTGINLTERSNITIINLQIKAFNYGVYLNTSYPKYGYNSISGNNITNCGIFGIFVEGEFNSVLGNNITENNRGINIAGYRNTIARNTVANNTFDGILPGSLNNISENSVRANRWGIHVEGTGNSITGNNITANNEYGIWIRGSANNNNITGNNIKANPEGIRIVWAAGNPSYNTISGNNITNNEYGIRSLHDSNHNEVSGNNVSDNTYGIWLINSSNNDVYANYVANNSYGGIHLEYSYNNTISENIYVGPNQFSGLDLYRSENNTISGNNITNNEYGIWLYESSNNKFYHNNLIDNTQQVSLYTPSYANFWDDGYPSGGNYWSNYTDVDQYNGPNQDQLGSDGIWDHPHILDADNQDNYPLTNVIPEFPTWASMLLILIVLTIVTFIYKRKLLKTSIR